MAQTALSNRQRKLLKQGRNRVTGVLREPNGRISRAMKAKVDVPPSWLSPELVRRMNAHPLDALEKRGAITTDQHRAALSWAKDREQSGGLPKPVPPSPNLLSVRAEPELRENEKAKTRYHELHTLLSRRCGVYGRSLAYELCVEGRRNEIIENMFFRMDHAMDVTERQRLTWSHAKMAFEEIEKFYAFHNERRKTKRAEAAA